MPVPGQSSLKHSGDLGEGDYGIHPIMQVKLLIERKANVKCGDRKSMSTPMHEAAAKGHLACTGKSLGGQHRQPGHAYRFTTDLPKPNNEHLHLNTVV